jgi:hypothetical protein
MNKGAILPLFYLPPTEYFSRLNQYKENLWIERFEHFPKQTYRNRAVIQSPNGMLNLIVPVIRGSNVHTKIKDVKISYDFNWQRLHWMSLQTSYRSSAYFEFYEHEFTPFYEKKWEFLFDYNEAILSLLLRLLKLDIHYNYTSGYKDNYTEFEDFRKSINPKQTSSYTAKAYFQVFEERTGFLPNLSVSDLLFSQGPQSSNYI